MERRLRRLEERFLGPAVESEESRRIAGQRLEARVFPASATEFSQRLRATRGRLRSPTPALRPIKVRFGNLRRLPEHYKGERHREIVKHLPDRDGREWVEFEEVPGPDPNPSQEPAVSEYLDIVFV